MAQKAITFLSGRDVTAKRIEDQINDYISRHPDHKIVSASYGIGGNFEKALVIVQYRDENFNTERTRDKK